MASHKKNFQLVSEFKPSGDQPRAIAQMQENFGAGLKHQTLLGVTGSGKTFSMAHMIANINQPALVLAPNKTLAAQLYAEFKELFPRNAVEYFVSYYENYGKLSFCLTLDNIVTVHNCYQTKTNQQIAIIPPIGNEDIEVSSFVVAIIGGNVILIGFASVEDVVISFGSNNLTPFP